MPKLTEPQIQDQMPLARGWERQGDMLVRTWQFASFRRALAFVNEVGATLERLGHHPDILLRFRTVRIEVSTQAEGGLTPLDFQLASELNALPVD